MKNVLLGLVCLGPICSWAHKPSVTTVAAGVASYDVTVCLQPDTADARVVWRAMATSASADTPEASWARAHLRILDRPPAEGFRPGWNAMSNVLHVAADAHGGHRVTLDRPRSWDQECQYLDLTREYARLCTVDGGEGGDLAASGTRLFTALVHAYWGAPGDTRLKAADPYVLAWNGRYYLYGSCPLYGSGAQTEGFGVFVSDDLVHWRRETGRSRDGLVFAKGDGFGTADFWAPEVHRYRGRFYLFYTANRSCCVAVADSPLGPFRNPKKEPLVPFSGRQVIDNSLFVDDDGTPWMPFSDGERFALVQLADDLMSVVPGSYRLAFDEPKEAWQNGVEEGPSIVRAGGKYVVLFSGDCCQNQDYAVGVGIADRVTGPWKRVPGYRFVHRAGGLTGTGHGSPLRLPDGSWRYFFHAHETSAIMGTRRTYAAPMEFEGPLPKLCGSPVPLHGQPMPVRETAFVDGAQVTVDDPFWSPRFALWRTNTVLDVLTKFDRQSHVLENFDLAAKGATSGHRGAYFFDGLYYEAIRGASDYLARFPSPDLERLLDESIDRIVAAQGPDGYLHTWVQVGNADKRWGDNGGCAFAQHELYNAGTLVEAGVHHYRATGKTKLLAAALRFANHLCDIMGPRPKRNIIPSHSIAEEALVKLARLLRDEPHLAARIGVPGRPDDYLALVKFWFDAHGDNCGLPDWPPLIETAENARVIAAMRRLTRTKHDAGWRPSLWDYQMDAKPLREYRSIEGHAVRAALLDLGLAAYARETGDAESRELALRFWHSMTGRKMYVTGGVGAKADLERFADDFELPPNAYLETCAAVASAFASGCLAEIEADGKFMDEFERVMYNALLTAVGMDGRSYTYQNPLNTESGSRWSWQGCPCCPPMFLKLTGALPGYAYSRDAFGLRVNLFMGGHAEQALDGVRVRISQRTRYPEDGKVEIAVDPERPSAFRLAVRVPGWARGVESHSGLYVSEGARDWSFALNGKRLERPVLDRGYVVLTRMWRKGDAVTLQMDVSPRTIRADPRVREVRGLHAVACGPVVMAEERGRMIPYWRVANEGPSPHRVWTEDRAERRTGSLIRPVNAKK